jgi:S-adenosyl methyltransferase
MAGPRRNAIENSSASTSSESRRLVDASRPNVARIYDTLLGSQRWPAVDQEAACELLRLMPDAVMAAYQNREFLRRAVRFLAGPARIRQFVDIGAGLPSQTPVHVLAQSSAPDARVLYVDNDPIVIWETEPLLAATPTVAAILGDLRDPEGILADPALGPLIDLDQPVAILMTAVLQFIEDDEDPFAAVGTLKAAVPPGSYLVLSHATGDGTRPEIVSQVRSLYRSTTAPLIPRPRTEVARFLDGWDVLPPGVVNGPAWRPGSMAVETRHTRFYATVSKRP